MKVPCEVMQAFRPRQDGQIMGLELLSIAIGACSNLAVARVSHPLPCKAFALFMIKFVEEISSFGPTTKGQSVPREKVAHQLESPRLQIIVAQSFARRSHILRPLHVGQCLVEAICRTTSCGVGRKGSHQR